MAKLAQPGKSRKEKIVAAWVHHILFFELDEWVDACGPLHNFSKGSGLSGEFSFRRLTGRALKQASMDLLSRVGK